MDVVQALRKYLCQTVRRMADFLFLWAVAVSAALYLGQSELAILPNIEWVWLYILGMAVLLDFIVLLLEKE